MSQAKSYKSQAPTIRRIKRHVEEETGGVWKIAYADFVTALMAFFVLMWLVSITGSHDKEFHAEFFNPYIAEESETSLPQGGVISIFDGGMMGGSSIERRAPEDEVVGEEADITRLGNDLEKWRDEIERLKEEAKKLRDVKEDLYRIMESIGELKEMRDSVVVDRVPDGLRIQVIDREGFSMFDIGSSTFTERGRILIEAIGTILHEVPNRLVISGHTDSVPYRGGGYGNWELSSDRANAARRALLKVGVEAGRIERVEGLADTRHYIKEEPRDPRNRRISILLLTEANVPTVLKTIMEEDPGIWDAPDSAWSDITRRWERR